MLLPAFTYAQDYLGTGNGRPFNLTGSLSYGYAFTRTGDTESELNSLNVKMSGNSPIWQPWFATLSVGLGLGLTSSGNTTGSESDSSSSSLDMAFSLFPLSRFPFRLTYIRNVNEIDAANFGNNTAVLFGNRTTSQVIGLQQTYTSRQNINYNFWYNNSKTDSDLSGEFSNSTLGFKIDHTRPKHRFDVSGTWNTNEQKNPNFETSSFSLTAGHGYFPSQTFGVNSLISHSGGESDTSAGVAATESSVSQVSSSFSWRPEHKPYTVSGGVRFSQTESENSAGFAEARNVNTSVTGSYRFSRYSRGTVAANVGLSESGGQQTLSASQNASIGYSSDSYIFAGFAYNWSTGLGASNSSTSIEGATATGQDIETSSQGVNGSVGHALGRNWVWDNANITFNVSQNVSASKTYGEEPPATDPSQPVPPDPTLLIETEELNKSLSQSFSLGGNHYGWGGSTVFNVSLSDTRTFNEDEVEFQVFTSQLSRQQGINRLSSASGAVYFQATRTLDPNRALLPGQDEQDTQKSGSMSFSYQHNRVFGLFGLRYKTTVEQTSVFNSGETKKGNLEWQNEFNYRIGLLSARLSARLIQTPEGEETLNMFFQATRTF